MTFKRNKLKPFCIPHQNKENNYIEHAHTKYKGKKKGKKLSSPSSNYERKLEIDHSKHVSSKFSIESSNNVVKKKRKSQPNKTNLNKGMKYNPEHFNLKNTSDSISQKQIYATESKGMRKIACDNHSITPRTNSLASKAKINAELDETNIDLHESKLGNIDDDKCKQNNENDDHIQRKLEHNTMEIVRRIKCTQIGSVDNKEILEAMLARNRNHTADHHEHFIDSEIRSNMEGKIIGGSKCESADESELTMNGFTKAKVKEKRNYSKKEEGLPPGWSIRYSKSKPNRFYYCHPEYGTTWKKPSKHPIRKINKSRRRKKCPLLPTIHEMYPNTNALPEIADVSPIQKHILKSNKNNLQAKKKVKRKGNKHGRNRFETNDLLEFLSEESDSDNSPILSDHEISDHKGFLESFYNDPSITNSNIDKNNKDGRQRKKQVSTAPALCSLQTIFNEM